MTWAESQVSATPPGVMLDLVPGRDRRTIAAVARRPCRQQGGGYRLANVDFGAPGGAQRVTSHPILGDLPPARPVVFTFDGEAIAGREGETLLPALLASGVRVLRTMPELGDPRGGYCLIGRCSDCQVVVDGVPSVRACVTQIRDGMVVQTQHGLGADGWIVAGDEL